ncbi:MAG: hypothetical protein C5S38_10290 [Candidatus Methanophagaceae archaeon]|nr:MAG: hypothetical protein C5S38_10290 [Methanophagales archaeon]KAF5430770.1 hypothetical protein C5S36_12250 [Methanophagales archaeon]
MGGERAEQRGGNTALGNSTTNNLPGFTARFRLSSQRKIGVGEHPVNSLPILIKIIDTDFTDLHRRYCLDY